MRKRHGRKIRPLRRYCDCGRKVRHHHKFCDKCWEDKMKKRDETKTEWILKKRESLKKGIQIGE